MRARLPRSIRFLPPLAFIACTRAAPDPATATASPPATATATPTAIGPADPAIAHDLVGTTPPPWTTEAWVNSPPLALSDLRGKVVLVRWFMGTSCPMCSATAPALKKLHADYASRGLVVIGMYHHKDDAPLTEETYAQTLRSYGFGFPVARDPDWKTLHAWWLDVPDRANERDFTSVSFLLDKEGRVRGVHPGGRLDYEPMRRGIERLIAEPPTPST